MVRFHWANVENAIVRYFQTRGCKQLVGQDTNAFQERNAQQLLDELGV